LCPVAYAKAWSQSEVFKLSDGIKAAVWHLPALDHGPDDNGVHDEHGDGPFRCSYPQCNAGMTSNTLLTRHYGKRMFGRFGVR
jgi:hypothetical protein